MRERFLHDHRCSEMVPMTDWARMKVAPNPANDHVVISTGSKTKRVTVQLIAAKGRIVQQVSGRGDITMSLAGVRSGYYAIKVVDAAEMFMTFSLRIARAAPQPQSVAVRLRPRPASRSRRR